MPIVACGNGKYRIGSGGCVFDSKEKAEKAYKAYLAKKHTDKKNELTEQKIDSLLKSLDKDLDELYDVRSYLYSVKEVINKTQFSERFVKIKEKIEKDIDKIDTIGLEKLKEEITKQLEEWKK